MAGVIVLNPNMVDGYGNTLQVTYDSATGAFRLLTSSKLSAGTDLVGKFQLRNPANTLDIGDLTNPIRIDPTGTTAQPVTQAVGSNLHMVIDSGTVSVTQSSAASLKSEIVGNKTHNSAVPDGTNIGVLAGVANASAPTLVDGYSVGLSTDLAGNLRTLPAPTTVNSTSGTITDYNGYVSIVANGMASAIVTLSGTWTGVLVVEMSPDNEASWGFGAFIVPPPTASPFPHPSITISSNGAYGIQGMATQTHLRIRAASPVTGTISVNISTSQVAPGIGATFASIVQNIMDSLYNNTATNLGVGESFIGLPESTIGASAIRIEFKADQPCVVSISQGIDGVNWDICDSLTVVENIPRGRVFQTVAPYFRACVQNIGAGATAYIRLAATLCPTVEVLPRALTNDGKLSLATQTSSWYPSHESFTVEGERPELYVDSDGRLNTRSGVMTDATSFRDDFTSDDAYVDISGTVYFLNGSDVLTGVGTSFLTELKTSQYIKADDHPDAYYVAVSDVLSDTMALLDSEYQGDTTYTIAHTSNWVPAVNGDGYFDQLNSELILYAGTTNNGEYIVGRYGDYGPFVATFKARISQRIANQEIRLGFSDAGGGEPSAQAMIVFSGTDDTVAILRTSYSSIDVESTTIALPSGVTTATSAYYRLEVAHERVSMFVNDFKLAEHKTHIPAPYSPMHCHHEIINIGTPSSNTVLYNDAFFFSNFDQVQTAAAIKADPISVKELRANQTSVTSVSASATTVMLLVGNSNRLGATFYNDSTATLYLKLGTTASATSYTVQLNRYDYYELPAGYTGRIDGIWSAATGACRITEIS